MKVSGFFKLMLKPPGSFKTWIGWNFLQSLFRPIKEVGSKAFIAPESKVKSSAETFATAAKRLQLNSADLKRRCKNLMRLAIAMLCLAVLLLGYALYALAGHFFHTALVSLAFMLVALASAFHYHFWWFQIKERRLSITFNEWFQHGFLRQPKPPKQ